MIRQNIHGILIFYCVFHIVFRIIFFKRIVKNNSLAQYFFTCISTMLMCLSLIIIYFIFKDNELIAPLKSLYKHIQFFGANKINCVLSTGKIIERTNFVKYVIANLAFNEATLGMEWLRNKKQNIKEYKKIILKRNSSIKENI